MSSELITREGVGPIEIHAVAANRGGGWKTPEMYLNLRPLGISAGEAGERLEKLLAGEMAEKCGVPIECVSVRTQQSWVDPRGRLVFWLTAWRPRIEEQGAIDV